MAAVQVKKTQIQAEQTIFALDIGTRSIIGMVGTVRMKRSESLLLRGKDIQNGQ